MTEKVPTAAPMRSWRPLRLMIVVTLILITLQIFLGELVSSMATYPATAVAISSIGDLFNAMFSAGGPMIFVHVFTGVLILLLAIGNIFLALRYHKRSETTMTLLGLISVVLALLGGYLFAASDFANGGGVLLMVNAAIGAYAFLFMALYFTK